MCRLLHCWSMENVSRGSDRVETLKTIECAGPEHDAECMRILVSAMSSFNTEIAENIRRKLETSGAFSPRGRERLICFSGDVPAGFLDYRESEICFLMVRDQSRRKGIGTHLLKAFEARTASPWKLLCFTSNHRALSFYAHHGYEKHRLVQGRFFGEPHLNFEMIKPRL